MHVYLTGATGYVGSYLLPALLAAGHTARCLVRDPGASLPGGVEKVKGDVAAPKTLAGTVRGCDAVIHLVGIIDEAPSKGVTFERLHVAATRHVVAAAQDAGVGTFLHMSANGARADAPTAYQRTKAQAEAVVQEAGFAHTTVFRPSLLFGDPGPDHPEFATRLARQLVAPFPILPVFGDGTYRLQPVAAQEVAAAFVQALTTPAAAGQTYVAAGPDTLSFNEVLDVIARALGGSPKPKLHQPLWLARPLVHTAGKLGLLPISPDQFEMLVAGNTGDNTAFYRDFRLSRTPFTPETLAYLKQRV